MLFSPFFFSAWELSTYKAQDEEQIAVNGRFCKWACSAHKRWGRKGDVAVTEWSCNCLFKGFCSGGAEGKKDWYRKAYSWSHQWKQDMSLKWSITFIEADCAKYQGVHTWSRLIVPMLRVWFLSWWVVNSCTKFSHAYKVKCRLLSPSCLAAEPGWNI